MHDVIGINNTSKECIPIVIGTDEVHSGNGYFKLILY
jgi:hypothetical protein